ncbi:MAG: metallophosphoesterase family protein [Planctomycetota bacterium]
MRTLAIGDIHGDLDALTALLDAVSPQPSDLLVTLGDYVDRGTSSREVLDRMIALGRETRHVAIRGNHDQLMLDSRNDADELEVWRSLGGDSTLASYGDGAIAEVPDAHWRFLDEVCVDWHETDTHVFVHAHVDPKLPLEEQSVRALHWRALSLAQPHVSGKTVVCGYTPQKSGFPIDLGHTICIDTAPWLSCVDLGSGEVWQADSVGRVRRAVLSRGEADREGQ